MTNSENRRFWWGQVVFRPVLLYLKQTTSHGKDPPDHLQGLTGVRQEGQPAEGKSHQHSWSNSHQQEQPMRHGSHRQTCVISEQIKKKILLLGNLAFVATQKSNTNVDTSLGSATSCGIPQIIRTYCLQVLNLGFDPCVGECSESHASAESRHCGSSYLVSWSCEAAG